MLAGRYQLESRIAAGGMGEVHVATDQRLHRKVAVKLLRAELAESGDFIERFRREALMSARLTHPSVARILDYGQDGSTHFIVMELVEGQDLAQLLRHRGSLTAPEAARIAAQVCDALAAAHDAGFVHRDIKPSNVIITTPDPHRDGAADVHREGSVKVTDFGIARALGGSSLTQTGTIMGTAQYVSPEIVRGEPASQASDIYSVGVLLFQMLTGRVPFDGDSPVTIALRHLDSEVPLPGSLVPGIPATIDEIVARATAARPEDRFPDARAMALALRAAATAPARQPAHAVATSVLALPQPHSDSHPESHPATRAISDRTPALIPTRPPQGPGPAHGSEGLAAAAVAPATRRDRVRPTHAGGDRRSRLRWLGAGLGAVAVAAALTFALSGGDETPPPTTAPTTAGTPTEQPSAEEPVTPDGPAMPRDAVGRERDDVVKELNERGLSVRWALVRSGAPEGSVIGTFPRVGETMQRGETAVIIVSRGQLPDGVEPIEVPAGLVGNTADAASATLQGAGLRFSTAPIPSDAAPGTVVGSWPASGEPASDGVVVLIVSDGPAGSGDAGDPKADGKGGGDKKKKSDD